MGYTTEFRGHLTFSKPLTLAQVAYVKAFNGTRRMKRDAAIAATLPDPKREAVGLPVGEEGGFFVGGGGPFGQGADASVVEGNSPPAGQPGLWCQWTVSDNGDRLEWDGGEKFYHYVAWLEYLIRELFTPWGAVLNGRIDWRGEAVLNGRIDWRGEEWDDTGTISVTDSVVTV